jgi:lipoprotein-releasing system permease protein
MRFEYLIGIRYLRARRRERFVSIIAIISLAGVMLGTFALTVALSMMSGFQVDLRQRLLSFTPEIVVDRTDGQVWNPEALRTQIAAMSGVVAVAPFVTSQVMAVGTTPGGAPSYMAGGMLRGVIAKDNPILTELHSTLEKGTVASLAETRPVEITENGLKHTVDLPTAIVGRSLALDLGIDRVGEIVTLISPASLAGAAGSPRLKRFVISGFFYSGMYDFDSTLIFVDLKAGRALLADDPQLESGLEVRVKDMFEAPSVAAKIAQIAGKGFDVKDWTQANAPLFSALQLEKFTYFLVLMLIVLVAAFNIIATLVMVVMERRKEIAILRAMGARAGSVAAIFLTEGAVLGVVGTVLGTSAGFVTSWAVGKWHLIKLPADMFIISYVPVRIYPLNFILVAAASIVLCVVAALYPALKARSLSPVEVIRYE